MSGVGPVANPDGVQTAEALTEITRRRHRTNANTSGEDLGEAVEADHATLPVEREQ